MSSTKHYDRPTRELEHVSSMVSMLLGCVMVGAPVAASPAVEPPALMLANRYDAMTMNVAEYLVSEKYDGVRAYWDGEALYTRTGHAIRTPAWFVAGWPRLPLDGELWIARGQFEALSAVVRRETPDEGAWRRVKFLAFDAPAIAGGFELRHAELERLLAQISVAWLRPVEQQRVADDRALRTKLSTVVAAGGEGLMLHRASSLYHGGRSDDLLKLKPLVDAEARVVAYLPGTGKYTGMMGAIEVEDRHGVRFRIGTGFSDQDRRTPPAIGSWVTYSYQGLTGSGVPRFARYVRKRD
jgi:DNA ligase-1